MNLVGRLFTTTIGRKFLMAVSGVVLVGFIAGHLVGNLQIFSAPDHINGYAHFLHSLGPVLWIERTVLGACVVLHIWCGVVLALEDSRARGSEPVKVKTWLAATVASRNMRWTGFVVLAFLLYHLAHFTLGYAQGSSFKANLPPYVMQEDYHIAGVPVVHAGTTVDDVHSMIILGFQNPVVSLFYIVAVGLLTLHLLHGVESLFQTFGIRNGRWAGCLRRAVAVLGLVYFLANLAIPGSIVTGLKGLRPGYNGPGAPIASAR